MKSLILQTTVKILFPFLVIASVLSLFRGHNEPGGGFIGGLVAASAFILLTFAFGVKETEKRVYIKPMLFTIIGLTCAFMALVLPVMFGFNFFEAIWADFKLPIIGRPGTPLLFDTGVYLVVTGTVCKIIFVIGD
ncbi:MAG: Na(+)/H(+) antiporter subunit B [Bacteroidetes bacterium]|nr:Na(+)/H(+) antiporter subunit B [Bacteroidota bacterium]